MGHRRWDDCKATDLGGITETGVGANEGEKTREPGRVVRDISTREHTDPFGTRVRYTRDMLDHWIRCYRGGGSSS